MEYLSGFQNTHSSEALPGALPKNQNSPQKLPYGLYAEQLSGSAFTADRQHNLRSWLYRIKPTVVHKPFETYKHPRRDYLNPVPKNQQSPNQMRWKPMPLPQMAFDFVDSLTPFLFNGTTGEVGCGIYLYACNESMGKRIFSNADGDLLIVPQLGDLEVFTEMGVLQVSPKEIVVIPRGIKFQIQLKDKEARGYVLENYGAPFELPNLGPLGSNALANPRDFLAPRAQYSDATGSFTWIHKYQHSFYETEVPHHPLDVVAWYGNYYPYKYDLTLFNTMGTVSFDHPDPSIFTVLTSPSYKAGTANVDFVIFPERWMVAENTFRPPYYHRNIMSEYMGLIYGLYDAKEDGFVPGGGSLHNSMSGHGPDHEAFEKASNADLKPAKQSGTLAFMFESNKIFQPTEFALNGGLRDKDYYKCWQGLKSHFHK